MPLPMAMISGLLAAMTVSGAAAATTIMTMDATPRFPFNPEGPLSETGTVLFSFVKVFPFPCNVMTCPGTIRFCLFPRGVHYNFATMNPLKTHILRISPVIPTTRRACLAVD